MKRTAVIVVVIVAALVSGWIALNSESSAEPAKGTKTAQSVSKVTPVTAAPTSAAGFQKMFDAVPVAQWGGGDATLSTKLADGRTLWVFADTVSTDNGFVNSSALVQTGSTLHVSNGGKQLLPKGAAPTRRKIVYWPEAVKTVPGTNTAVITAARMSVGSDNGFDFRRANVKSRQALVKVSKAGDVTFSAWVGWTAQPKQDTRFLSNVNGVPNYDKSVLYYGKQQHKQFTMKSGKTLVSINRNYDGPFRQNLKDYRPIWTEQ